ncbi:hypothetical protein [Sorangium cellulosum]|uniref:hypothetical protein n=1 Tax=Sorangium cellulosum TaxID=56 RepID=UPI0013311777|nr:hypothetical protein [Sorangium cellulosum]
MQIDDGHLLIEDLLKDPRKFDEDGCAYTLLQKYFSGLPVDTLRPLLRSENVDVQRVASFVASELGNKASGVLDDAVPLVDSSDAHVQWYAMEVVAVCAKGNHVEKFVCVVGMLESANGALRRLAMRLMMNADLSQLSESQRIFERRGESCGTHEQALRALVAGEQADPAVIVSMLRHNDALVRRYGAIAARRLSQKYPELSSQIESSDDPDLLKF